MKHIKFLSLTLVILALFVAVGLIATKQLNIQYRVIPQALTYVGAFYNYKD